MKKIIIALTTVLVSLLALPEQAQASPQHGNTGHSHIYQSGHASCGCVSYSKRVLVSYDYNRRPVYSIQSVPVVHSCRSNYRSNNNYSRNNYSRNNYSRNNYSRNNYSRNNYSRNNYSRNNYSSNRGTSVTRTKKGVSFTTSGAGIRFGGSAARR